MQAQLLRQPRRQAAVRDDTKMSTLKVPTKGTQVETDGAMELGEDCHRARGS